MKRAKGVLHYKVEDGLVFVGSDAHYWPGQRGAAHRAFVLLIKELKPKLVVLNGDVIDASTISRHPPIGWEDMPSVAEELEVAQERLAEIEKAAGRKTPLAWTLGNHDARFETRLASVAPQYERVLGVHLKDHFSSRWAPAWGIEVNRDVFIKHRFKGGMNAARNNALISGRSVVAGHLHRLGVAPVSDLNGTRFGVDGGMLAPVYGPQFTGYTEANPLDWRSGFTVLRFQDGVLGWPELVHVMDEAAGLVEYNGERFTV